MENEYIFVWKIKFISHCWLKKGEALESLTFDAGSSQTTKWSLVLYPRGIISEDHVGIYLRRHNDSCGPNIVEASFRFEFLNTHFSFLQARDGSKRGFAKGSVSGIGEFVSFDKIFGSGSKSILPEDILIVRCILLIKENVKGSMTLYAATLWSVFQLNHRCFFWRIVRFSTLTPGQRNQFVLMNESKKVLVSFHLVSGCEGQINLEIISCDESFRCFSFKTLVIDSEGQKVDFGNHKFFADFEKIKKVLISREQLMKNESRYLPNDVLSLACEFTFSSGDILHTSEEYNFGIISLEEEKDLTESEDESIVLQQEPRQLMNDLKSMYDDSILCDIQLRTSTQTFLAHKTILSARSSVFRRMFSNDMKEKNSGHVDITDLEDDTVHRMLLYIYTDALEDLKFESASMLYSAADKYAIFSLKEKCSSFLMDNVSPTTACDLLALADRHQDDDLKRAVQDYILSHDDKIFGSLEWKDFMATNLQLAADIMYRKVCPGLD